MLVCFCFSFFAPTLITSYAASNDTILNAFRSEEAIYSQTGITADTSLAEKIRELGIPVTDNSLIEIVPVQAEVSNESTQENGNVEVRKVSLDMKDNYIYSVTNTDGNNVTQHFIMMYELNDDRYDMIDLAAYSSPTRTDQTYEWPSGYPMTVTGYIRRV